MDVLVTRTECQHHFGPFIFFPTETNSSVIFPHKGKRESVVYMLQFSRFQKMFLLIQVVCPANIHVRAQTN